MLRQKYLKWIQPAATLSLAVLLTAGAAKAQEIPYEVKVNYSLAAENFKNEDYEAALPYLRWLLENAPTVYNGERIHRRAVDTYAALADATDDDALAVAYLDTALTILKTAPTTLQDAGSEFNEARWELEYGNFLERYGVRISNVDDEAVNHWMRAYELDPANLDPYYVRKIVETYAGSNRVDQASAFMDDAEQHYASDPDLMTYFDEKRNELFKSPEERIAYLEGKLAAEPDNIDIVRELFGIYGAMGMAAEREKMGARLLELDPSTSTYVELADLKVANAEYKQAIDLYQKALGMADSNELKRDMEYKIARTYYDMGQLQSARSHAKSALGYDSKFGNAYLLIGDILVKAVQESEFEREDRAVYWLAMDYYERAGSVDPDLRSRANQKVQQYAQYMPTKEDKFFQGWKEGSEYAINYGRYSWVNETTHVR